MVSFLKDIKVNFFAIDKGFSIGEIGEDVGVLVHFDFGVLGKDAFVGDGDIALIGAADGKGRLADEVEADAFSCAFDGDKARHVITDLDFFELAHGFVSLLSSTGDVVGMALEAVFQIEFVFFLGLF